MSLALGCDVIQHNDTLAPERAEALLLKLWDILTQYSKLVLQAVVFSDLFHLDLSLRSAAARASVRHDRRVCGGDAAAPVLPDARIHLCRRRDLPHVPLQRSALPNGVPSRPAAAVRGPAGAGTPRLAVLSSGRRDLGTAADPQDGVGGGVAAASAAPAPDGRDRKREEGVGDRQARLRGLRGCRALERGHSRTCGEGTRRSTWSAWWSISGTVRYCGT